MVLEIKKNQRTLQGYVSFFGQFFHDNFLFFEAFEILIRTNVFLF
jgi:hypothetical protein